MMSNWLGGQKECWNKEPTFKTITIILLN